MLTKLFFKFFLLISLILIEAQAKTVYKWVDKDGQVKYSDTPPALPKEKIEVIKNNTRQTNSRQNSSIDQKEQQKRFLEAVDAERKEKKAEANAIKEAIAKLKEKCSKAEKLIARYQTASSLFKVDEQGQQVTLSDEERQAEELKVSSFIEENCQKLEN